MLDSHKRGGTGRACPAFSFATVSMPGGDNQRQNLPGAINAIALFPRFSRPFPLSGQPAIVQRVPLHVKSRSVRAACTLLLFKGSNVAFGFRRKVTSLVGALRKKAAKYPVFLAGCAFLLPDTLSMDVSNGYMSPVTRFDNSKSNGAARFSELLENRGLPTTGVCIPVILIQ